MSGSGQTLTTRVFLVEEHELAHRFLCQVLCGDATIRLISADEVRDAGESEGLAIVVDQEMLALPLSQCIRGIRTRFPSARFVVLHRDASSEAIRSLAWLGVEGLVAHAKVEEQLAAAVRAVGSGGRWIPSEVLQPYLDAMNALWGHAALTRREMEIVELVKRRLSNREIARILNIKESTVKYHLSNVFGKLEADRGALRQAPAGNGSWMSLLPADGKAGR